MFKFKEKITDQTCSDGTKDVDIMVPLKYLSNFWRTLEMPLINHEISLIVNRSTNCLIIANSVDNPIPIFLITDKKFYVPVVTLSIQDNAKLSQPLKSGSKRTIP